jgi:hypothetical protein
MKWKNVIFMLFGLSLTSSAVAQDYRLVEAEKLYLATDRYYFMPGEIVDYGVFLSGDFNQEKQSGKVRITLENSRGQVLDSVILVTTNSNLGGSFTLPASGGIYFLKAIGIHQLNYLNSKPIVKELFVQEYVTKDFFIDIELDKNNYNPKGKVPAEITYTSAGNKRVADMEVEIHLVNNGEVLATERVRTSPDGAVKVSFVLPEFDKQKHTDFYITTSANFRGKTQSASRKVNTDLQKIIARVFYEHGNSGYILNQPNKVIVKSEDTYGNDLDITGKLLSDKGVEMLKFESFAQGLGSFVFTPKEGENYLFVAENDTIILEPAEVNAFLNADEQRDEFSINVNSDNAKKLRWIVAEKSKILKDEIGQLSAFKISINRPTILSSTLLWNGEVVAQRHYLVGYEKISYAEIETKDSILMAKDFNYISIKHPTGKAAVHSTAIIEENNIKQMEDKSHNALTWILLGSEYNRDIERPQFYFDPENNKAKEAISLLMNTLHPASIRDVYTGKVMAIKDKEYANNYQIRGSIRENDYRTRNFIKNAEIVLKNSNISTVTDEEGKFQLDIPASFSGQLELIVKKGIEKQKLSIPNLGQYQDFSNGFSRPLDLVLSNSKMNPAVNLVADKINFKFEPRTDFNMDGVQVVGAYKYSVSPAYTSQNIELLPSRSLNSIASVMVTSRVSYSWYWSSVSPFYPNDLYMPSYQYPFEINLEMARFGYQSSPTTRFQKNSTLYWAGYQKLDADSQSIIKRNFSPTSGGYRILVEGVDQDGEFFYGEKYIQIKEKLDVVINIPKQLYLGDEPKIPVSITNNLSDSITAYVVINSRLKIVDTIHLAPFATANNYYSLGRLTELGKFNTAVWVQSPDFSINKTEQVNVSTYKIQETVNIAGNTTQTKRVNLSTMEEGTLTAQLKIFPTFDQQLIDISESLLRQPGGCFEQVSSSNYPNIMVLLLMKSSNSKNAASVARATSYLESGYQQLANYETPSGGFEWYGRNPPHESLTAYGLLQFYLLKEVGFTIDEAMFNRNLQWLWNQKDKKGGFSFHAGKYGFASAPYEVNNAYITWVLSRVSTYNLDSQIEAIKSDLHRNFDAYKMALLVNILFNTKQNSEAEKYLKTLKEHLVKMNFKDLKAEKSVVNAYGKALDTEVLALTLLASLNTQHDAFKQELKSAIFSSMNDRGYFGSTQATALSLEALSRFGLTETNKLSQFYEVKLNGFTIDEIDNQTTASFTYNVLNLDQIVDGINTFEVKTNGVSVPYVLEIKWVESRESNIHPELDFSISFEKDKVKIGEQNLLKIRVKNTLSKAKGQVVASVNIPETYQLSTEELRDLTRKQIVDYYEIKGNTLNLYFLEMGPKEEKEISLNLTAFYAGKYHSATHDVFEYYNPEIVSKVVSPINNVIEK